MGTARAPWPAGPPFRSHVIVALEAVLTGSRPALTVLLPGLLALLRRHLPPPLGIALCLRALVGREVLEPADGRVVGLGRRGRTRRRRRLRQGDCRDSQANREYQSLEPARRASLQHGTHLPFADARGGVAPSACGWLLS